MDKTYVKVEIQDGASKRTKERFAKFKDAKHRIELINGKIDETLKGDGFIPGEPMIYFGIDIYNGDLWARRWEGWIPDKEIELSLDKEEY